MDNNTLYFYARNTLQTSGDVVVFDVSQLNTSMGKKERGVKLKGGIERGRGKVIEVIEWKKSHASLLINPSQEKGRRSRTLSTNYTTQKKQLAHITFSNLFTHTHRSEKKKKSVLNSKPCTNSCHPA